MNLFVSKKIPVLVLLITTSVFTNGLAQRGFEKMVCAMCKDGIHNEENPYNHDFRSEVPFIVSGVAAMTFGIVMQATNDTEPYSADELNLLDRNEVNAFDRTATYNWSTKSQRASDILRTSVIILPVAFLANHNTRSDFGSLLIMGLEVSAITYGLTAGVKHAVNRTRPLVYNDEVPLDDRTAWNSRLSYFSGHTSFTAAFSFYIAKVIHDYHPNLRTGYQIGLWSFAAALPAATGYLRVRGGKHFPTDVITGYAVGAFIGWVVPELHKKKIIDEGLSILPSFIYGSSGIYLSYRF